METSDFKILRKNRFSFEMQHKTGDQYVVLYRYSYYSDEFLIQSKDTLTKDINETQLKAIAQHFYHKTRIADISTVNRSTFFGKAKEDMPFVIASFNDLKTATNPEYISYYCFILMGEIGCMKKQDQLKYFPELIPYLSCMSRGLNGGCEQLLENLHHYSYITDDMKKESLFAAAKSPYNFDRNSYCYRHIVEMLCDFVSQRRGDLREVLAKYPIFHGDSSQADFLLEKYDGVGIIKKELPPLLISKGKCVQLYSLMTNNPSCFIDYFQESGKAIELVRYLSLHGYNGQVKEMAEKLLPSIRHPKDYYALRVFLTDDEVLQVFKKFKEKTKERMDYLAFAYYEKKEITNQVDLHPYYYESTQTRTLSNTYGYAPLIKELDEYYSKEMRRDIRDEMGYRSFDEIYTYSLGLIEAGDKISFKYYFTPEAEDRYLQDPYFCLTKAYLGLKQQKKIKDMYPYKEAK